MNAFVVCKAKSICLNPLELISCVLLSFQSEVRIANFQFDLRLLTNYFQRIRRKALKSGHLNKLNGSERKVTFQKWIRTLPNEENENSSEFDSLRCSKLWSPKDCVCNSPIGSLPTKFTAWSPLDSSGTHWLLLEPIETTMTVIQSKVQFLDWSSKSKI